MKREWQIEIDKWLKNLQPETVEKLQKLINILNEQKELLSSSAFSIPYLKFEHARLSKSDAEGLLFNLDDRGIISAVKETNLESPGGMRISSGSLLDGLGLINPQFEYLFQTLKKRVSNKHMAPRIRVSFSLELYDKINSTLKIGNSRIKIPAKSNMDYLCQIVFLNLNKSKVENLSKAEKGLKEWSNDEILELSDGLIASKDENAPWRVVYNAVDGINDKIARQIQIEDFFEKIGIKTFRINSKYLK